MNGLWQLWKGHLSDEVVDNIIKTAYQYDEMEAEVGIKGKPNNKARSSKIRWIPLATENTNLINLLYDKFDYANRYCFGLDIHRIYDIQYTEYHAEDKGFYNEHMDTFFGEGEKQHRKLSMTIQLSDSKDYEGGDFIFNDGCVNIHPAQEELRMKGTVLVFPSIFLHQVNPVTKGIRKSLVSWIEGPAWR